VSQPAELISEAIRVDTATMDAPAHTGEPGTPRHLTWRKERYEVAQVLDRWKSHGNCTHGSGERYLRRHWMKVRTAEGPVMTLYFERKPRRGAKPGTSRWYLYGVD